MKKLVLFSIFVISSAVALAQTNGNYEFQSKYHMIDSSELYVPLNPSKSFTVTNPPTGTIRPIAEWEQAQAVIVSYPGNFGIPYSLIAEMSENCKVITIVQSSSQQTTVTSAYNSNGVTMANCQFVIAPLDSYWSRDYGPWFIMINNSQIGIVDFPYNRPSRTNDDNVPVVMSSYLSEPLYGMNIFHTGGNFMNDGVKAAAMTDLVLDENTSLTEAQVDTLFKQYMGITNNYITADPLGDYIKHVDCWGKFLDVDKILIASVPTSNTHYSDYEAMAVYWASKTSSYGNPYQVYRVYEPNGQPYTNSLILNNKVLVPIKGGSSATYDNQAISVYQQAMPGYEVLGFTQLSSAAWASTDALHCRTHEVADKQMLYIKHQPLLGAKSWAAQFPITANIYALSGSALIPDSVYIKYKVNNGTWTKVLMTSSGANTYTANIPQQSIGDTIRYYIHASDQSPRNTMHPLIGAPDPHKFYISTTSSISNIPEISCNVFPNPASDKLFINMSELSLLENHITICDLSGAIVKEINLNNRFSIIDLNGIPAGAYLSKIVNGDQQFCKKLMIVK